MSVYHPRVWHVLLCLLIAILLGACTEEAVPSPVTRSLPSPTPVSAIMTTEIPNPALTVTPTPVPTLTPIHMPTPDPTVTPIPIPIPTSTPIHTPTPEQFDTLAVDSINATVSGYWSDGTADVEVAVSLRNDGTLGLRDALGIAITCTQGDQELSGCDEELNLSLPDGFGPAVGTLVLRVPMGEVLLELDYGGDDPHTMVVEVPEKIVGVDRDVWECFSDTANRYTRRYGLGCAGWTSSHIERWDQDKPVKVWVNPMGETVYIRILKEVLSELSPVLNLEFQYVESEDDANFIAHAGVPSEWARQNDLCPLCAISWDSGSGFIDQGRMVVVGRGLAEPGIRHVTLHEALHALIPVGHPQHNTGVLSQRAPKMSFMDEALFRLHSHPLIEVGMSMSEVESIIVLSNELIDAREYPEPTGTQVLWRAMRALTEAQTFSFETQTAWPAGCEERWSGGSGRFDVILYGRRDSVYFDDGVQPFYAIDYSYEMETWVNEASAGWTLLDLSYRDIWNSTQYHYLDWTSFSPIKVFALLITRPEPKDVTVESIEDGQIMLRARFEPGHEIDRSWAIWDSYTFLLDEDSYEVSEYVLEREQEGCDATKVHATEGRYRIDIEFPDEIRNESTRLSFLESLISQ